MRKRVPQPPQVKPSRAPTLLGRYIPRIEFRGSRRQRGLGDMSRLFQHHYIAATRLHTFQMNLVSR